MFDKRKYIIQSEYLHRDTFVGAIIPSQVERVLILLHGYNGSFELLDETLPLSEYAVTYKMAIVTPNMDNGYYIDKAEYRVSEFLKNELIPFIYKTSRLKEESPLYIAGISMGGYGSLLLGVTFPNMFEKVISISGALIAHDVAIGNPQVVGDSNNKETLEYFTSTFAPFDTLEDDMHRNPVAAIFDCKADDLPELIITCGTEDELYSRNLNVLGTLFKKGVRYDWFPIEGGVHDYKAFDEGLRYAFEMIHLSEI